MTTKINYNNYNVSKLDYESDNDLGVSDDEMPEKESHQSTDDVPKFKPKEESKFEPEDEDVPDFEKELDENFEAELDEPKKETHQNVAPISQAEKDKQYIEHLTKVNKILKYFNSFPDIFPPVPKELELEQLSDHELSDMLRRMQIKLNCRSNYTMIEKSLSTTPLIVEGVTMRFGLKTRGLAQCCLKSKSFQDSLKSLALKYSSSVNMSPEMQLIASFTEQVYILHTINSQREKIINEKDSKNKEEKKINKNDSHRHVDGQNKEEKKDDK